jgi:long-chain fatty acid transport protein
MFNKMMMLRALLIGTAITTSGHAFAGAFGLREQSATGQGLAFAGAAAGGAGLGSMFWNPAAMTDFNGIQVSASSTFIVPYAKLTTASGSAPGYAAINALGGTSSSGDEAMDAYLPAGYMSWQINDQLWAGLSVNAPYGLSTKPDSSWSGRTYNSTTSLRTITVTPTLAYKFNDQFSVAAGISYMSLNARYTSAAPALANPANWGVLGIDGSGSAWGYTLGATFKPTNTTEIGIGYRSEMRVDLKGDFFGGAAAAAGAGLTAAQATALFDVPIQANLPLPQTVNLGIKQIVNAQWTVLAGLEWTNWSVLKSPAVLKQSNGANHALFANGLPFNYQDGLYASLGAEYQWNPNLTLRGGLGYEWSPVKDSERSVRLPDNDRLWTSLGFGYKLNEQLNLDFGYTHIFPKSTKVTINSANSNYKASYGANFGTLLTDADTRIDIVSLGLTYKFDTPAKAANLPGKKVVK